MSWIIIWVIIAVVLAVIEAFTLGLTTIWFAAGAIISAIFAAIGAPLVLQIIIFLVVSVVLLYFTRPIVMRGFNNTRVKTNAESLVGKHAYVTEGIDNVKSVGKIKIDGMEWTARTEADGVSISEGSLVEILSIEGVKTIVKAIKEETK